jgi:excisionase family DNA binding protein
MGSEKALLVQGSRRPLRKVARRGDAVNLELPDDVLSELVDRVADRVLERLDREHGSPWLTRKQAASYLGLPVSRLEKDRRIPVHRDGRRILYHRDELDAYFRGLGVG